MYSVSISPQFFQLSELKVKKQLINPQEQINKLKKLSSEFIQELMKLEDN